MRFTKYQYEIAIQSLRDGMAQLDQDGHPCAICGDSGHLAATCPHNPLRAMALCREVYEHAGKLHDILHEIIGAEFAPGPGMGLFVAVPDAESGDGA